jgi:hypothetical protein
MGSGLSGAGRDREPNQAAAVLAIATRLNPLWLSRDVEAGTVLVSLAFSNENR